MQGRDSNISHHKKKKKGFRFNSQLAENTAYGG